MEKTQKGLNRQLDFSAQLNDSDKNELHRIGQNKNFGKNAFIFRAGDFDANIWILTQGRVKIFKSSAQGRDLLLWFATPGDIFGIAECMHERSRLVNARTAEPSELLCIPHEKFKKWVIARPEISYLLMQIVAERLRDIGQRFLSRTNGNIQLEISQLILSLGTRYGAHIGSDIHIGIPLTEQDIADMAGISRQGVSSFLAIIKRQGLIDCEKRFMIIKEWDQLKKMTLKQSETRADSKWINKASIGEQTGSHPILL